MPRNIDAENNYRKALKSLRILAIRDLVSWWKETEVLGFTKQKALMLEPFQAVVATYGEQAAYAAAEYLFLSRSLDDHLAGLDFPDVADPVGFEQAKGSFEWAMNTSRDAMREFDKQLALRKLAGITNRLVAQPARRTVMQAVEKAGTAYARIPEPGACSFCLMLASRGAVYSKDTVLFKKTGGEYHDNCRCLGIEVQKSEDLPQINRDLEAIWKKSVEYPGDDRASFDEALTRYRNGTPDWVPNDAIRVRATVTKPWSPHPVISVEGVHKYDLVALADQLNVKTANQQAIDVKEQKIYEWFVDQGAEEVQKIARITDLPNEIQQRAAAEFRTTKTPDFLVDGVLIDGKTVAGPSGIKNNAKRGAKQAQNLVYDLRHVDDVEGDQVIRFIRNAARDSGHHLDRIVTITQDGTFIWERDRS